MSPKVKKLYYSISEVSELTGLKQYVLRYWETEFPNLHPTKNKAGNRTYRTHDIEVIQEIKRLLYNEKYTIDGARRFFKQSSSSDVPVNEFPVSEESDAGQDLSILKDLKSGVDDLLELIHKYKN